MGSTIVSGSDKDMAIVRYLSDGRLDSDFDNDGLLVTEFEANRDDFANGVSIHNGGIVVVGRSDTADQSQLAVVRYNDDGTLAKSGDSDLTFSTDGRVTTSISSMGSVVNGMTVDGSGNVVVVGASGTTPNFTVLRYELDGDLDTSFDSDGIATTSVDSGGSEANAVAIQSDGDVVVVGYAGAIDEDFAVVRYSNIGALDITFDMDGIVTTSVGLGDDRAYAVALQSDGKIVVAGTSHNGSDYDLAVVRYNSDGSLDTDFDTDGKVTTDIGSSDDFGYSLVIQSDGKIVVAGQTGTGSDENFVVVRYTSAGALDPTFYSNGKVETAITSNTDIAYQVGIDSNGSIVVGGLSNNGSNNDFAVVRLASDGTLDPTFDTDGMVTTAVGSGADNGVGMVLQANDKIVMGGSTHNGSEHDFALVRYATDGSLDTSLSTDGVVTLDIGSQDDFGHAITLDSLGRLLIAGITDNGSYFDLGVARCWP